MITYFNDLVTKNFNNYLKKYFNSIDYTDKNGNFINYYNFIRGYIFLIPYPLIK